MDEKQHLAAEANIIATLMVLEQSVLIMYPEKSMSITTEIRKNFYDDSMRMGYYGNISDKLIFFISKAEDIYTFEICTIGAKPKRLPDKEFERDNANQQILLKKVYDTIETLVGIDKIN